MKNREEWLTECIEYLREPFGEAGFRVPKKIRVSCSWPSKGALAAKAKRIGEAWSAQSSGDEHYEIFISPILSDPGIVGATLTHELCHCVVGLAEKHGKRFRVCAVAMGLEGPITATTAGEALQATLAKITRRLGKYPHAELLASNAAPKQTTRMMKVECAACGCIVRMTRKWLEEAGAPTCACGNEMIREEQDEPEDSDE